TLGFCCGWSCAKLDTDTQNCGDCFVQCPAGQTCQNGRCSGSMDCGPWQQDAYCDPDAGASFLCCAGLGCIDTSYDSQNCGFCGAVCDAGTTCDAGVCVGP